MEHLKADPELVGARLATIADSLAEFARACIETGAAGVFFAAKGGEAGQITRREFEKYVKPHDLTVLRAAEDAGATFNLLHLCGRRLHFESYTDYPAHAVNWAPQQENISLSEGRELFKRTIVGGVDQNGPIVNGGHEEIVSEVRTSIGEMGTSSFMLSAGCALPSGVSRERLLWARQAVFLSVPA